jgi:hypothetical protein
MVDGSGVSGRTASADGASHRRPDRPSAVVPAERLGPTMADSGSAPIPQADPQAEQFRSALLRRPAHPSAAQAGEATPEAEEAVHGCRTGHSHSAHSHSALRTGPASLAAGRYLGRIRGVPAAQAVPKQNFHRDRAAKDRRTPGLLFLAPQADRRQADRRRDRRTVPPPDRRPGCPLGDVPANQRAR